MSVGGWHTALVLGGIRSGKSRYADALVAGTENLRRVNAAAGEDLTRLAGVLAEAKPDETLLVDGLDRWLATGGRRGGASSGGASSAGAGQDPATLAAAVRACDARLVLVSPEVGLTVTPSTVANRNLADALGSLNQAVAEAADAVVLVVAGQPSWLKGAGTAIRPAAAPPRVVAAPPAGADTEAPDLASLKGIPTPDEDAKTAAADHLASLGTVSLGALETIVSFAAGAQGSAVPAPWHNIRVLVLHGDHGGAAGAGAVGSHRQAAAIRDGVSPLARLATQAGASVQVVATAAAAPIEDGPAMTGDEVEQALANGWRLAQRAVDEGVDLIVLGAIGDGAEAAAAAVVAVTANAEPASLLARVRSADGMIDDPAWMRRCAAVRDAVRRARSGSPRGRPVEGAGSGDTATPALSAPRTVLAELAGPDIATAAGLIAGAAARRTPVLLDGPVGAAAGLVTRSLAGPARHWCLLADHGGHPTVVRASEVLGLTPLLDMKLELGEGASALAALPLLRSALVLASAPPARAGDPAASARDQVSAPKG